MISYKIRIDMQEERESCENIVFTSGDARGYKLDFEFYSYGKKLDVSGYALTVKAKRADGAVIIDSGTTSESGASYIVADNAYNIKGELALEVALVRADGSYATTHVLLAQVREGFGESVLLEADNEPVLAKLEAQYLENRALARANSEAVSENTAAIEKNAAAIEANSERIAANKSAADEGIAANAAAIDSVRQELNDLNDATAVEISALREQTDTNLQNILANSDDIEANRNNIEVNTAAISNLEQVADENNTQTNNRIDDVENTMSELLPVISSYRQIGYYDGWVSKNNDYTGSRIFKAKYPLFGLSSENGEALCFMREYIDGESGTGEQTVLAISYDGEVEYWMRALELSYVANPNEEVGGMGWSAVGAADEFLPCEIGAYEEKYGEYGVSTLFTKLKQIDTNTAAIGDMDAALDELHAYAQALAGGGDN